MTTQPIYEHDHLCPDVITKNARTFKNNTAVVCGNRRLTWSELDIETNKVANALLDQGFTKNSKICMLIPNAIESFVLFWGVIKAGCVIVPLNMMLDGPTLARLANSSDGEAFFVDTSMLKQVEAIKPQLSHIADKHFYAFEAGHQGWQDANTLFQNASQLPPKVKLTPEDSMTLIYTSGTTGTPKGIEHNHFGRLNYCYGFSAGLQINRYSVAICTTPIYASGTWITMLPTIYNGGKVVLIPKFSPEAFLQAVASEGGTHSFMVPAQYITLLQHDDHSYDTSSLKVLVSAGQSMSPATRTQLLQRFKNTGLHEVYGMTEGFFTIAVPKDYSDEREGTVGKPGFLEDIRIIDLDNKELSTGETGEIVAYGPGMMKGYYGRPDLTEETIWTSPEGKTFLRSGDLGYLDKDHFLYISGRKKDMIKSGGINIYAADIEDVLMNHPGIKEVAVIGVPHPRWSETPVAIAILKEENLHTENEILQWTNDKLAKYQRLSQVIFCTDFPRATYGKIKKDTLRELFKDLF